MRQLLPPPASLAEFDAAGLDRLYGAARTPHPGRPWVAICMITSLDGATATDGRSGELGRDGDRQVFAALRRAADAIIVGAATARAERYRAPVKAGQRIGVVTSTGDVDRSTDLFASGSGFLVMPEGGAAAPPGIDVVRAGTGLVDVAVALERLDAVMDPPTFVQAEGGPRLNAAMLDAGVVDELDLSIAPFLVGGPSSRVVFAASETMQELVPAHVLADDDGYLFTRWVRQT